MKIWGIKWGSRFKKEVIQKTPQDHAIALNRAISEFPTQEQDAIVYHLFKLRFPGHHVHENPKRRDKRQTEIQGAV